MTSDDIDLLLFGTKTCPACGATYPANSEHFARDASTPDGLKRRCKGCVADAERSAYRRRKAAKR